MADGVSGGQRREMVAERREPQRDEFSRVSLSRLAYSGCISPSALCCQPLLDRWVGEEAHKLLDLRGDLDGMLRGKDAGQRASEQGEQ